MATEEQIKGAIKDISQRQRSVRFEEIEWVLNHLPDIGIPVRRFGQNPHYNYFVGNLDAFQLCSHHRGQAQVKSGYVNKFVDRMLDLGLLDE